MEECVAEAARHLITIDDIKTSFTVSCFSTPSFSLMGALLVRNSSGSAIVTILQYIGSKMQAHSIIRTIERMTASQMIGDDSALTRMLVGLKLPQLPAVPDVP